MIGYIKGEILEHADGKMLICVGDRGAFGGVGYSVAVPQSSSYLGFLVGGTIELFVYTHVREDAFDLFGFATKSEKALFLALLSVNGIGPKSALGILSAVEADQLVQAILEGDQGFLVRIPGIGKKTAERVVVELRDSIHKKLEGHVVKASEVSSRTTVSNGASGATATEAHLVRDAKEALMGLGYREQDIQQLLNRVIREMQPPPSKVEDLIRTALRQLA